MEERLLLAEKLVGGHRWYLWTTVVYSRAQMLYGLSDVRGLCRGPSPAVVGRGRGYR